MLNIFPSIKAIASLHLGYNSNEWQKDISAGYMERIAIKMLLLGFVSLTCCTYRKQRQKQMCYSRALSPRADTPAWEAERCCSTQSWAAHPLAQGMR